MALRRYHYFSTTDAARMGKLQLFARDVVEGLITGLHKSPHRGFSAEFSEHRKYVAGDEVRHMDWKVVGRSDRYYIKLFEQETNLRATLVLDNSNSMQFGQKLDYAKHIAACLAYLLAAQQDLAGLCAVDESIRIELPPASSPAHIDRLFRELEQLPAGTTTSLVTRLHELAERLPRRGMVVVISDLWVDPGELLRALQHLRYRKHQSLVIHLLDQTELQLTGPSFDRQITLEDLETGEKVAVDPADIRDTYRQQVQQHVASVKRGCVDCECEYHPMDVATPYDKALVEVLGRRK